MAFKTPPSPLKDVILRPCMNIYTYESTRKNQEAPSELSSYIEVASLRYKAQLTCII